MGAILPQAVKAISPGSSPKTVRHSRKGKETELYVDGDKRRADTVNPRRKCQSTDRIHGRFKNFGTPKGPKDCAEIEDVLASTKINGFSSDT